MVKHFIGYVRQNYKVTALDGNPTYRFAVVPHPTAGLSEAELKKLAPTCAAALEAILLRSFGV